MSALSPLLRSGLLVPARRVLVPRAQVHAKPAREKVGVLDSVIGLTACFMCFLLPPAWVLSHLDNYKKRE